jgi:hypothetical protein
MLSSAQDYEYILEFSWGHFAFQILCTTVQQITTTLYNTTVLHKEMLSRPISVK